LRPSILLVLVVALAATPALGATPEETAAAREHFAKAKTHYDLNEWEMALKEFKDAYRYVQDPKLLYNIAQCHWKLGQKREAIEFYKNYLRREPNARNRAEVERRIDELEKSVEKEPAPPAAPVAPPPVTTTPPILTAPPPMPAATVPMVETRPASEPSSAQPVYKRWWFWTAVGAAVVGGVVAGIALSRGGQELGTCPTDIPVCVSVSRK
jgi:tetratricopeptide (TPR) repeat protein